MKISGRDADRFIQSPPGNARLVLLFGGDLEKTDALSEHLAKSWTSAGEALRRVTSEDLKSDAAHWLSAIAAESLFGEKEVFLITADTDAVAKPLLQLLETPFGGSAKIILRMKALTKRSKTRLAFEADKHAHAVQVFDDDPADLSRYLEDQLAAKGLALTDEALDTLHRLTPPSRQAIDQELERLALFALDLGRSISKEDIASLHAIEADASMDGILNKAFSGQATGIVQELDRYLLQGGNAISLLRAAQRHVDWMLSARLALDRGEQGPGIGERLFPRVFRNEWPSFERQLRPWSERALLACLADIYALEAQIKSVPPPEGAALTEFFLKIMRRSQIGQRQNA